MDVWEGKRKRMIFCWGQAWVVSVSEKQSKGVVRKTVLFSVGNYMGDDQGLDVVEEWVRVLNKCETVFIILWVCFRYLIDMNWLTTLWGNKQPQLCMPPEEVSRQKLSFGEVEKVLYLLKMCATSVLWNSIIEKRMFFRIDIILYLMVVIGLDSFLGLLQCHDFRLRIHDVEHCFIHV